MPEHQWALGVEPRLPVRPLESYPYRPCPANALRCIPNAADLDVSAIGPLAMQAALACRPAIGLSSLLMLSARRLCSTMLAGAC